MKCQFRPIFGTPKSAEISEIRQNFGDVNPILKFEMV